MVAGRWTISKRLYTGFGALLLLTVLAGSVAIWASSRIKANVETVTQRSTELQRAMTILTALFKIESGEKSILWAGLDNDRQLYESSKRAVLSEFELAGKQVDELTATLTNAADQTAARMLRQSLAQWQTAHNQVVAFSDSGNFANAQQLITSAVNSASEERRRGRPKHRAPPRRRDVPGKRRSRHLVLAVASADGDGRDHGDDRRACGDMARPNHQREPEECLAGAR